MDNATIPRTESPHVKIKTDYVLSADKVKAKRDARGWTQAHVARLCGMRVTNYARFEQADSTPRIDIAKRVAVALDCHLDDLIE